MLHALCQLFSTVKPAPLKIAIGLIKITKWREASLSSYRSRLEALPLDRQRLNKLPVEELPHDSKDWPLACNEIVASMSASLLTTRHRDSLQDRRNAYLAEAPKE